MLPKAPPYMHLWAVCTTRRKRVICTTSLGPRAALSCGCVFPRTRGLSASRCVCFCVCVCVCACVCVCVCVCACVCVCVGGVVCFSPTLSHCFRAIYSPCLF